MLIHFVYLGAELPLGQALANVAVTVQDRKDNLEEVCLFTLA